VAYAYVLYLNDKAAAPAFELIRRAAQPNSKSRPHVTVRYPVSPDLEGFLSDYETAVVDTLTLQGAGVFLNSEDGEYPKTVYVECASEQLEALNYKPDYPDSVFHITLYDGAPTLFSAMLSKVVAKFPWNLEVQLRADTNLSKISVGKSAPRKSAGMKLSKAASDLLSVLSTGLWNEQDLLTLSDGERIKLIDRACHYLHVSLPQAKWARESASFSLPAGPSTEYQIPLWDDVQALDMGVPSLVKQMQRRQWAKSTNLFLTPPEVASEMVRTALSLHDEESVHFGDPAIGNGIFFATLVSKLSGWHLSSAVGYDLDQTRIEALNRRWASRNLHAVAADFLERRGDESRSLVLANPPYLRYQGLSSSQTQRWRRRLFEETSIDIDGQADLFVYFVLAAHCWMKPGAVACWLLPVEFMESRYGKALRDYLTKNVALKRVHVYDRARSRFENARVSSTVVVFQKREPRPSDIVHLTTGNVLEVPATSRSVSVAELGRLSRWRQSLFTIQPRSDVTLSGNLDADGLEIRRLFRVRRGIATGANAYFVLNEMKRRSLGADRRWLKPLIPKSRFLSTSVIEADSDSLPSNIPQYWLIDTDESLANIRSCAPGFAEYLDQVGNAVGERRLVRSRKPFYRQERIPSPALFFGYMARSDSTRLPSRFFLNRSSAVILNNYLGLYPVPRLQMAIDDGLVTWDELYAALLEIERSSLLEAGRNYVSGLSKAEPSDLSGVLVGPQGEALFAKFVRSDVFGVFSGKVE